MAPRLMSVAERISYLHDSEKYFDVEFILQNNGRIEGIKGHKAIFASASDVFDAMLYGPLAMGDTVKMNDIDIEAFKTLRRFIYTDDVVFQSVAHAQNIFKVADMYDLMQLSRLAEAYISANLSSATALRILEFTQSHQKLQMQEQCLQIIRSETSAVLNGDDFFSCDLDLVDLIVSEKDLNIKEIDLFNALEKWAENNIKMEDDPSANEVQQLSAIISKIRFLSMSVEEFAKGPSKSALLRPEERLSLITNIAVPDSMQLPDGFTKERSPRNGVTIPVSMPPSGDFPAASKFNPDFVFLDGISKIKWTKRGMSTLQEDIKYYSPVFKINGVPFSIYFKPKMSDNMKYLGIGLKCHEDNVNCKVHATLKYIREEEEPETHIYRFTFNGTQREVEKLGWSWFTLGFEHYITSDDKLTMEFDLKLARQK